MVVKCLRRAWLAAVLLIAGFAQAQPAPDLYAVGVPVAAQGSAELQRAAAQGLRELMRRLTGRSDSDLDNNAALSSAYAGADRYLEQYRYERNTADSAGATPWLVQLRFSPAAVNQLLRNAALNGSAENIVLRVSGIAGFGDYTGLLNYLARLMLVKTANPILVANDEVTLQLKIQGNIEQLARQFAAEGRLTPQALGDAVAAAPFLYRWAAPRG